MTIFKEGEAVVVLSEPENEWIVVSNPLIESGLVPIKRNNGQGMDWWAQRPENLKRCEDLVREVLGEDYA